MLLITLVITYLIISVSPFIQKLSASAGLLIKSLIRTQDFGPSEVGGRLSFWEVAFELFKSKPFIGYGLGTYYTAYYIKYQYNGWYSRFAHNEYLQILSEEGIIGLILFIFFLLTCFIIIIKILKKKNNPYWMYGAIAGSLAFLLHIGMDFSWNYPGSCIIFFALLGSVIVLENEYNENKLIINNKPVIIFLILSMFITIFQFTVEYIGEKGINLSNEKKYYESNNIFEFTEKFCPFNDRIYYLHSLNDLALYSENKNISDLNTAEYQLKKSIEFSPYNWDYYNQLGLVKLNQGLISTSIEYFEKSAQYSVYRVDSYINLGTAYYYNGNIDKAKEVFLKGLQQQNYAFIGLDETEKSNVTTMLAQMNLDLAIIYSKDNNDEMKINIYLK